MQKEVAKKIMKKGSRYKKPKNITHRNGGLAAKK